MEGSTSVQPFAMENSKEVICFPDPHERGKKVVKDGYPCWVRHGTALIGWWLPATRERMSQAYISIYLCL